MNQFPTEIKDSENPNDIYKLVPGMMQSYIDVIPESLWEMSIEELEQSSKASDVENKLRINLWLEYDRACRNQDTMRLTHVYKGVCSQTHFLKKIITNSFKLAYLLCPPEDYTRSLEHLVYKALKTESKILDAPLEVTTTLTKNDGSQITTVQFDSKLANVIWRMRESYENRLRGTAIHRSTQLNRNVNENYNSSAGAISADTLAQLSPAKLQELVEALQNGTAQDVQFTIPAETTKGIVTDEE